MMVSTCPNTSQERTAQESVLDDFVKVHWQNMLSLARRYTTSREDAEDAVTEAAYLAHKHLCQYNPEWPFEAWFRKIVVNACLAARRRHTLLTVSYHCADDTNTAPLLPQMCRFPLEGMVSDTLVTILIRERRHLTESQIARAMSHLREDYRDLIYAVYLREEPREQVAARHHYSRRILRDHLARARACLRQHLSDIPTEHT